MKRSECCFEGINLNTSKILVHKCNLINGNFLNFCVVSGAEIKLASEPPKPQRPLSDWFPASHHLKIVENCFTLPWVSDSYCSSASHKPAGVGYLIKGGRGSKVSESCPLATSHQMAPKAVSGCQEPAFSTCRHTFSLRITVVTPCLSSTHFNHDYPSSYLQGV